MHCYKDLYYLLYQKCFSSTLSNLLCYDSYSSPCVHVSCIYMLIQTLQIVWINWAIGNITGDLFPYKFCSLYLKVFFSFFTQAVSLTDGKYAVPTKVNFSFAYTWMETFTCTAKAVRFWKEVLGLWNLNIPYLFD